MAIETKQFIERIEKRLVNFSVKCISFLSNTHLANEHAVLRFQLSKSASSIGANFIEAQATSYKEFTQKMRIALREAKEAQYWITIIYELQLGDPVLRNELRSEIREITKILGSIVSNCHQNLKQK